MNNVVHDMEIFLDEEMARVKEDALCEVVLIKAKLASLLAKYGYEK